jgi:hypothetical protein
MQGIRVRPTISRFPDNNIDLFIGEIPRHCARKQAWFRQFHRGHATQYRIVCYRQGADRAGRLQVHPSVKTMTPSTVPIVQELEI